MRWEVNKNAGPAIRLDGQAELAEKQQAKKVIQLGDVK